MRQRCLVGLLMLLPGVSLASAAPIEQLDLTGHWVGVFGLAVFVLAYLLVMAEEFTHLRKSKPVIIAAGPGATRFLQLVMVAELGLEPVQVFLGANGREVIAVD